jgi:hypothetical protein
VRRVDEGGYRHAGIRHVGWILERHDLVGSDGLEHDHEHVGDHDSGEPGLCGASLRRG